MGITPEARRRLEEQAAKAKAEGRSPPPTPKPTKRRRAEQTTTKLANELTSDELSAVVREAVASGVVGGLLRLSGLLLVLTIAVAVLMGILSG